MNALTFNNVSELDFFYPQAISISQDEESAKALKQAETLEDKFLLLKKDIGVRLFNRLTYEQKVFIINVSNTINLGGFVDIDEIYNDIENLEYE